MSNFFSLCTIFQDYYYYYHYYYYHHEIALFLVNILNQDKFANGAFDDFSPGLYFNIFPTHLGISI